MHPKRSPADVDPLLHVHLDRVLAHLRDCAIFTQHADRRVATWNAGAEHVFGYAAGEIVGQSADVFFTLDDRAHGAPREEAETAARQGRVEHERWRLRKDGSRFFASGMMSAVRDDDGDLIGFVTIVRDLTERRQAAQALAECEQQLRQAIDANRVKDEFLSTVSHELRTPLNAVLGWIQLVRGGRLSADGTSKALEVIERNARTQAELIANLFDVSRVVTGQIRLSLEPTSIVGPIMTAVETIEPVAEAKRVLLDVNTEPDAGDIIGDSARPPAGQFAGVTIVAIDDDADARELMGATLSAYGAKVIVAASVAEGLDAVREHQPDLILTDLAMPDEDGFAFIKKLRHLDPAHLRRIPAVALTAYVRREDRARLLDAGYQAHLSKPFDLDELTTTAAALLGSREVL